jgi:hypothetical protein
VSERRIARHARQAEGQPAHNLLVSNLIQGEGEERLAANLGLAVQVEEQRHKALREELLDELGQRGTQLSGASTCISQVLIANSAS